MGHHINERRHLLSWQTGKIGQVTMGVWPSTILAHRTPSVRILTEIMTGGLIKHLSPEAQELQQKQAELFVLETQLTERELELATLQAELHRFERLYLQTVGMRQQELQRIEAQIEEYTAYLCNAHQFQPSTELKQLYRQLAKSIHPDLANTPEERAQREQLMAVANQAYERGDIEQLKAMIRDWSSCPESVQGDDVAAELLRTLRKIAKSEQRLASIEQTMADLEQSDAFQMQRQVQRAQQQGRDLLVEMSQALDQQIQSAQKLLNKLKTQTGYSEP